MKKPKVPELVTTAIITTVTIFSWIAFSVYRAFITTPTVNVPPEILAPLSPELDTDTLSRVGDRLYFEEGQTVPVLIPQPTEEVTPNPSVSPSPTATVSAAPTQTPTP